jgi:hypothetical protein
MGEVRASNGLAVIFPLVACHMAPLAVPRLVLAFYGTADKGVFVGTAMPAEEIQHIIGACVCAARARDWALLAGLRPQTAMFLGPLNCWDIVQTGLLDRTAPQTAAEWIASSQLLNAANGLNSMAGSGPHIVDEITVSYILLIMIGQAAATDVNIINHCYPNSWGTILNRVARAGMHVGEVGTSLKSWRKKLYEIVFQTVRRATYRSTKLELIDDDGNTRPTREHYCRARGCNATTIVEYERPDGIWCGNSHLVQSLWFGKYGKRKDKPLYRCKTHATKAMIRRAQATD